jgi:hypothetical protein
VADLFIFLAFRRQKFTTVTILNNVKQILLRRREIFMFSGILFSKVISSLIKTLKKGSPGLLRDHPSNGDLPIARTQPTALLVLS